METGPVVAHPPLATKAGTNWLLLTGIGVTLLVALSVGVTAGLTQANTPRDSRVVQSTDKAETDKDKDSERQAAKNVKTLQSVLDEISLPPIRPPFGDAKEALLKDELLQAFDAKVMEQYPTGESKLRAPIQQVRATLWAYSTLAEPSNLKDAVKAKKADFKNVTVDLLKDAFPYPQDERAFQKALEEQAKEIGKILSNLRRLHEEFIDMDDNKPGGLRKEETNKRWQLNYDSVLAHLEAQIAFLYEYQSMLGLMRKELPPKEPGMQGWRLSPMAAMSGDIDGKRMAKSAGKIFDAIAQQNANTPWSVLAKRERTIALGLAWKSFK